MHILPMQCRAALQCERVALAVPEIRPHSCRLGGACVESPTLPADWACQRFCERRRPARVVQQPKNTADSSHHIRTLYASKSKPTTQYRSYARLPTSNPEFQSHPHVNQRTARQFQEQRTITNAHIRLVTTYYVV
ncbi:hypothetical protein FRC12_023643 [Ceratobasidium sp. 428]|nr:hypothetical protein FRC12_023643 [Ceratobasidium sp. 428]